MHDLLDEGFEGREREVEAWSVKQSSTNRNRRRRARDRVRSGEVSSLEREIFVFVMRGRKGCVEFTRSLKEANNKVLNEANNSPLNEANNKVLEGSESEGSESEGSESGGSEDRRQRERRQRGPVTARAVSSGGEATMRMQRER